MKFQNQKGLLIIVDGPSGTGKDSLINALALSLSELGLPVNPFSEEKLDTRRDEILQARQEGRKRGGTGDLEMTDALVEHRTSLYDMYVNPVLKEGGIVVANRGETATEAYQTANGELTLEEVWEKHRRVGIPIPNLVVITTCSPGEAVFRINRDNQQSGTGRKESEQGTGLSGKVTVEQGAKEEKKIEKQKRIHEQYELVKNFLEGKGARVLTLNTGELTVEQEVRAVLKELNLE